MAANQIKACPNCGKPMAAGILADLCPACLLGQGASPGGGSGEARRFTPPPVTEVARLFPQLEILGLLGAGGMGAVYKARQPALDRWVALKVLPAHDSGGTGFAERFNREARALARLSHPNIVAVHEFGQAGGLHYFIMEFVDGANLRQLEQAGRLSPREALQIIPQICDALQYAHDTGVVHRDIKPENVLVDRKGRVKIADFGLAKILGHEAELWRLTAEGQVMGTPHYMAPEQVERPLAVDHRADIYSLGVVLYEMLTGDLPLGKFPPPSRKVEVDVRFDEVVLRALENNPEHRYQKASEVKSRVERIAQTPASGAGAPAPQPVTDEGVVRWAGITVVVEREGRRHVSWGGVIKAFALVYGMLTIGFGGVSVIAGRSLFGWLGVVGWPSLVARAILAAAMVTWGVWRIWHSPRAAQRERTITPQGTVVLPPVRSSRKAVAGACWVRLFFLAAFLYFFDQAVVRPMPLGPMPRTWWQQWLGVTLIPLGLSAPLGTTVLGWLAVADIRRLRGRMSGLGLAVFDGLFFPLLALDAVLLWLGRWGVDWWRSPMSIPGFLGGPPPAFGAMLMLSLIAICVVADVLIVRRVWRAVRLDVDRAWPAGERWWSPERGGVVLAVLCVVVIGLVANRRTASSGFEWPADQIAGLVAGTGSLTARLPAGGTVELVGLSDPDSAPDGWWRHDGVPLSGMTLEAETFGLLASPPMAMKLVLLRLRDLPGGSSGPMVEFMPRASFTSGGRVLRDGVALTGGMPLLVSFSEATRAVTMRVGLRFETWRTIATQRADGPQGTQLRQPGDPRWDVNFSHEPAEAKGEAQISYVFGEEHKSWTHRVIAVDTNGTEHSSSRVGGTPAGSMMLYTATFLRLPLSAVEEFRVEVSPVYWVEFCNVALRPRKPLPRLKPATFGPVEERTFAELIDFDTGKTVSYPPGGAGQNPFEGIGENARWVRETGLDAEVGTGELSTFDMIFAALANADWDTLTATELQQRIYQGQYRPQRLKPLREGELPATFGFRTREGGIGVLQLVALDDRRPGATVRFKRVAPRQYQ